MQFAAAFHGPVFTRGLERMQGATGPFWGHNAIVRLRAFAESCALPELRGKPPFGGHILSHDYVEAALLAAEPAARLARPLLSLACHIPSLLRAILSAQNKIFSAATRHQ